MFWYHHGSLHKDLIDRSNKLIDSMMWTADNTDPKFISLQS